MIGYYNRSVILTYISLGFAILGMALGAEGAFRNAMLCLIASGFCDMFDGKIARKTKRSADAALFGIQIDSLCDVICFGVLPCVLGYHMGMKGWWMIPGILFLIGGVIRLGYFNVMEQKRQETTTEVRKYYEGLPITSTAIIFPIYYLILTDLHISDVRPWLIAFYIIVGLLFVLRIRVKKPTMLTMIIFIVLAVILMARLLQI